MGAIVGAVRERGDQALKTLVKDLDSPEAGELQVPWERLTAALNDLDAGVRKGLDLAIENVRAVAEDQLAGHTEITTALPQGQSVMSRTLAAETVGIYAPGGEAAYPSSVVMCAIPAQVAGVTRIAIATPPGANGSPHPVVLAACALCGVDTVYAMGGAHAIAALAYGTETVGAVNVIVGPGNAWVQEAKRQVYGQVGIDSIAGPSELVVIADATADPREVALDLAAQAEHGAQSMVVAVSDNADVLEQIAEQAGIVAERSPSVADAELLLVHANDIDQAIAVSNFLAPEHLELQVADAESLVDSITAAGCVFVGGAGATAFGDYVAGSNHVLPTGGGARFSGPLGVDTFLRRQALVSLPVSAARELAPSLGNVARAEGFPVHAESAEVRAQDRGSDQP